MKIYIYHINFGMQIRLKKYVQKQKIEKKNTKHKVCVVCILLFFWYHLVPICWMQQVKRFVF